ncbi:MAG TPA: CHRD domain-containing protein [Candidatus Saccharimonadales bacterium]|nr:CHRD domain-containing protein [Candidatus Saccharimonadales bacterium]
MYVINDGFYILMMRTSQPKTLQIKQKAFPSITLTMILAIVIAGGTYSFLTTTNLTSEVFAQSEKFNAKLTGKEEVPPVDTQATGMAEFMPNGENVNYVINATNIKNVTEGHIHTGVNGTNGPIVVTLFMAEPNTNDVNEKGSITADKLRGPLEGKAITDLVASMKNGSTYANIHTDLKPNGEIRGQIMSVK